MKCYRCPLYHYWNNESDRGESCAIFGDGWDSPFQYENNEGIVGCYLDRHYIEKVDSERDEYYASMAESMARQLKTELTISKMEQVDEPQTDIHDLTDCDFCKDRNCKDCEGGKDEPQTDYDKGLQQLREIMFDKEKSEQFLKECEAMGIKPDCPWR